MNTERLTECGWLEEQIDAWACGESAPEDAARIDAHLDGCPACAELAAEARVLDAALAELPMETCPPAALENAFAQVDAASPPTVFRWRDPRHLAIAAMVLIALGVAVVFGLERDRAPEYSQEELAQAERELTGALGYLAQTGAYGLASAFEETAEQVARMSSRGDAPSPVAESALRLRSSLGNRLRDIGNAGRDGLGSAREQFMEVDVIASFSGNLRALRDASATQNRPNLGESQ